MAYGLWLRQEIEVGHLGEEKNLGTEPEVGVLPGKI